MTNTTCRYTVQPWETRMAPSYANLFLAKFETDALSRAPYQPHTWWRYIDDIFMIWTHSVDELHAFTSYLNNIHPTIKFTSNYSFTSIPFLDVNVSVNNGNITTDLYTKATDKHQYLLHSSCHPQHTKRAIPFSLALRLRRICSSDETFKQRSNELKSFFILFFIFIFIFYFFLLDNNIYLHQHTIQYIIYKLLQTYLAYIGNIATTSHLTYLSSLVHGWLLNLF